MTLNGEDIPYSMFVSKELNSTIADAVYNDLVDTYG